MNKVVMILSAVVVASGGGAIHVYAADAAPAKPAPAANPEKEDAAAMLVRPGVITSESLEAATRSTGDSATASQQIANQVSANPRVLERLRVRIREQLPAQHPDIEEVLSLSTKEVNKLFDVLAKQGMEAAGAGAGTKSAADRAKANEAELATLLGKKYPQWQAYKAALPLRLQVRDLGAALIAADIPMSDKKIEPLIAALAAVQKQNGQTGGVFSPESNAKLTEAAAAYLSPEQIEVYRKILERHASRARKAAAELGN